MEVLVSYRRASQSLRCRFTAEIRDIVVECPTDLFSHDRRDLSEDRGHIVRFGLLVGNLGRDFNRIGVEDFDRLGRGTRPHAFYTSTPESDHRISSLTGNWVDDTDRLQEGTSTKRLEQKGDRALVQGNGSIYARLLCSRYYYDLCFRTEVVQRPLDV